MTVVNKEQQIGAKGADKTAELRLTFENRDSGALMMTDLVGVGFVGVQVRRNFNTDDSSRRVHSEVFPTRYNTINNNIVGSLKNYFKTNIRNVPKLFQTKHEKCSDYFFKLHYHFIELHYHFIECNASL